uniref:Uncharacterized protein n=1 Tax=Ascaris lumbricoides TaxID=6252 RepID=A0A0M3HWI9_ASCLU
MNDFCCQKMQALRMPAKDYHGRLTRLNMNALLFVRIVCPYFMITACSASGIATARFT